MEFIDDKIWKPVHTLPGFECCIEYYVNAAGEVKSTKGEIERILKPKYSKNGIRQVNLTQRIGRKNTLTVPVHKLVAFAFLGQPATPYGRKRGCSYIKHVDGDKSNNKVSNLIWAKIDKDSPEKLIQMADKLTLRGVKRIEDYTEPAAIADRVFSIKRPITGKDQFPLKRWWTEQGNRMPKRYVNATLLNTTIGGTAYVLAVVANQDTRLEINLDGTLTFGETHSVQRMGLFSADLATLYIDYIIPKIPGVDVTAVTINALPAADTTVNSASVAGEASPTNGDTETYTATATGDATPYTYTWTITGGTLDSGQSTSSATVTWGAAGAGSVAVVVGSTNANFDGNTQTDTLSVTIA